MKSVPRSKTSIRTPVPSSSQLVRKVWLRSSNTPNVTVAGIDIFLGSSINETIISDGDSHSYFGNGGSDYMVAEAGAESMDGGVGDVDTLDLTRSAANYTVNMTTGATINPYAGTVAPGAGTAVAGTMIAGVFSGWSMRAVANSPGFRSPDWFGTTASMVIARRLASRAGEMNRTVPVNSRPG